MKRGFTLVELLAVIVILAVIALITIPAVMKIIDTSTINSYRRSIDLYGKAVSQGIISYESDMVEKNKPINITFENIDSYIEYEGNDVDCKDKTIYSDRTILLTECTVQDELVYGEKGKGYGDENYYYYTNSKKKMKLIKYIEAVEEAIKDKNVSGTCTIGEDKITCNGQDIKIKSKLENAIEGTLTIENNKVKSYSNLKFATEKKIETNNEVPQVVDEQNTSNENNNTNNNNQGGSNNENIGEKYISLISDADNNGVVSIGDKYTYKINDNDTFNFYVLSIDDDKINLIMDNNICSDGKTPNKNNQSCFFKWYGQADDSTKGPIYAMTKLYISTKGWTNVPNMELTYNDEGHHYKSFYVNNGVGTIIGFNINNKVTIGTTTEPLKARLPELKELVSLKCEFTVNSCPDWILENLGIQNVVQYWILSSFNNDSAYAVDINGGLIFRNTATGNVGVGLRPVITVPMSYLTN